jgi:hypothetical protein
MWGFLCPEIEVGEGDAVADFGAIMGEDWEDAKKTGRVRSERSVRIGMKLFDTARGRRFSE